MSYSKVLKWIALLVGILGAIWFVYTIFYGSLFQPFLNFQLKPNAIYLHATEVESRDLEYLYSTGREGIQVPADGSSLKLNSKGYDRFYGTLEVVNLGENTTGTIAVGVYEYDEYKRKNFVELIPEFDVTEKQTVDFDIPLDSEKNMVLEVMFQDMSGRYEYQNDVQVQFIHGVLSRDSSQPKEEKPWPLLHRHKVLTLPQLKDEQTNNLMDEYMLSCNFSTNPKTDRLTESTRVQWYRDTLPDVVVSFHPQCNNLLDVILVEGMEDNYEKTYNSNGARITNLVPIEEEVSRIYIPAGTQINEYGYETEKDYVVVEFQKTINMENYTFFEKCEYMIRKFFATNTVWKISILIAIACGVFSVLIYSSMMGGDSSVWLVGIPLTVGMILVLGAIGLLSLFNYSIFSDSIGVIILMVLVGLLSFSGFACMSMYLLNGIRAGGILYILFAIGQIITLSTLALLAVTFAIGILYLVALAFGVYLFGCMIAISKL